MNLKNNRITVRELMDNPNARVILERRFPEAMRLPIVAMSGSMTLERAIVMASAYIPKSVLLETVRELEAL